MNAFSRTERILGKEAMDRLANARVAVFGVGGVGGYAVEALVRGGVGALDLIDNDQVAESNLNRQIIATKETIGMPKVDVARARALQINPNCMVTVYPLFYLPENADQFPFSDFDYILDAIDTVSGKISLAVEAKRRNIPIISAMGAGNKVDPTALEVADLSQTSVCPLARVMRRELKKRGIVHLKVVYSKEMPRTPITAEPEPKEAHRKQVPGSTSFVPSVAGLIMAGEVIRDLTGIEPQY